MHKMAASYPTREIQLTMFMRATLVAWVCMRDRGTWPSIDMNADKHHRGGGNADTSKLDLQNHFYFRDQNFPCTCTTLPDV